MTLDWDASVDPTVAGYHLYYGDSSRGYTNVVIAGTATSAIVTNLSTGSKYFFAATTYNFFGLESDFSAEVSYVVPAKTVASLQAFASSQSRSLAISGTVGTSYQIQYCTNLTWSTGWYPLTTYTQTNAVQTVTVAPTTRPIFYRVQELP